MKKLLPFILVFSFLCSQLFAQENLSESTIPGIENVVCTHAVPLAVNATCKDINKLFAGKNIASTEQRGAGRIDMWYSFYAPVTGHVSVITSSDFGDIISVYEGECSNLKEVNSIRNGQQSELRDLVPGNKYFIRVNVTIGVIENEDCIMIKSITDPNPETEKCIEAREVSIGDICTSGNNKYSRFTGPKPSCVPYADANVWFTVKAPESGTIKLNSGADFYHVLAVYSGRCNQLNEIFCSKNPEKCSGYLEVKNLSPGTDYYIQIASAQGPFGYNYGNFCLEILDGNSGETYVPINLNAGVTCSGNGFGHINYTINGGKGKYTIEGNTVEDLLQTGQRYGITVKDEWGCEVSFYDRVECGAYDCQLTAETYQKNPLCYDGKDGSAGINVMNENGSVKFEWSDGQKTKEAVGLKAGTYTVTITDSKYCELTKTVIIEQPEPLTINLPDQNSDKQVLTNLDLSIIVSGGTSPYSFKWEKLNETRSSGDEKTDSELIKYNLIVSDSHTCKSEVKRITVKRNVEDPGWFIYPLPASKEIHIRFESGIPESGVFNLLDSRSMILKSFDTNLLNNEIIIPVNDVPPGLYLLQFKSGKHIDQRKVIIQR